MIKDGEVAKQPSVCAYTCVRVHVRVSEGQPEGREFPRARQQTREHTAFDAPQEFSHRHSSVAFIQEWKCGCLLADWFWCRGEPLGTCRLDSQLRLFLTGSGPWAAAEERVRLGRLRRNFSAETIRE